MADECELMRKIVGDAFWQILYHERMLARAHGFLAVVRALVTRVGIQVTDEGARDTYEANEDECECETPVELLAYLLGRAMNDIEHHETQLRGAHNSMALTKGLAERARIEVPMGEIEAEERKRLAAS